MSYAPGMGTPVNGGIDGRDCGKAAAAMIDGVAKYKDTIISDLEADGRMLDWMIFHGARVRHDNDCEFCRVEWEDRDGAYSTTLHRTGRSAIASAVEGRGVYHR